MKDEKLGLEPAFPSEVSIKGDGSIGNVQTGNYSYQDYGMSKRFYAACAAMQGLLANDDLIQRLEENGELFHDLVSSSYLIADELLKQENQ